MKKWPALVLLSLPSTTYAAGPCGESWRAQLEGPSPLSFLPARFGAPRGACSRNEIELAGTGRAIVQPKDFYGNITAAATLAGRLRLFERGEVFGAFELLRYQTVISALSADHLAPGDLTLGASWRFVQRDTVVLSGFARGLFPTARGIYDNAKPFGAEIGASMTWADSPRWSLFSNLALLGTASASAGPSVPRGAVALALGGTYRPSHGLAFLLELDAQSGYADPLDHFAVGLGVRVHRDRRGFEFYVKAPLVGRDRTLILAGLRLRYDFDVALGRRLR